MTSTPQPLRARFSLSRPAPAALLLSATLLAGCASRPALPPPPLSAPPAAAPDSAPMLDPVRAQVVFTALQMVGVPYRYGGQDPGGFDCSGLVLYSYRNAGLSVPRTSREQFRATTPVRPDEITPGDLVFFRTRQDVSHVGIYVGEGRFVHAPSTSQNVRLERLDNGYYRQRFIRAGRL